MSVLCRFDNCSEQSLAPVSIVITAGILPEGEPKANALAGWLAELS